MEVLIAIGIFAIGMVAVAAIFPTAFIIQRNTFENVLTEMAAKNAAAMIEAEGHTPDFEAELIDDYHGETSPEDSDRDYIGDELGDYWEIQDRALLADHFNDDSASFYWYPLVRDANGDGGAPSFVLYAMVFRPPSDSPNSYLLDPVDNAKASSSGLDSYRINFTNGEIGAGDWILTDTGVTHRVLSVDDKKATVTGLADGSAKKVWFNPRQDPDQPLNAGIVVVPLSD